VSALSACVHYDIKKIIAYSTCSQLGFMVAALGLSQYHMAFYHLITHAFFKSLLFLSAGLVITALSGEQDFRKMGDLVRVLPVTSCYFFIGILSLCGFPFFSGYYSKELILSAAYLAGGTHPFSLTSSGFGNFAYILLLIASVITTYYSVRMLY